MFLLEAVSALLLYKCVFGPENAPIYMVAMRRLFPRNAAIPDTISPPGDYSQPYIKHNISYDGKEPPCLKLCHDNMSDAFIEQAITQSSQHKVELHKEQSSNTLYLFGFPFSYSKIARQYALDHVVCVPILMDNPLLQLGASCQIT